MVLFVPLQSQIFKKKAETSHRGLGVLHAESKYDTRFIFVTPRLHGSRAFNGERHSPESPQKMVANGESPSMITWEYLSTYLFCYNVENLNTPAL